VSDYRVLVLDLDGTTLTADNRITERDLAAARALQQLGVQLTIATGRLFTGTRWVAEQLGVTGSVAVMNGSELIDVETGAVTHGNYVDRRARTHARQVLAGHDLSTFLFGSRRIHFGHRDEQHAPYLGIWTEELTRHDDVFQAPAWHEDDDIVAIAAAGEEQRILAARDALHDDLHDDLGTVVFRTFTGESFLKLRHHGDDKGSALQRLAAERSATAEQTVAVGDWINDVPMLRAAGRSFVMSHATPELQAEADEVLDASRETGGAIAEVARRVWGVEV
jgi:Cof subfamily protein (haloacid dehalogenase superfamily)